MRLQTRQRVLNCCKNYETIFAIFANIPNQVLPEKIFLVNLFL